MARPKTGDEKHAHSMIGVRVSDDLKARLNAMAAANGRALTDEVRAALVDHVARHRKSRSAPIPSSVPTS